MQKGIEKQEAGSRYAECPYYLGDGSKKIRCEGIIGRSELHLDFEECREKALYMREHCNDLQKCRSCRIHHMLDKKWEV